MQPHNHKKKGKLNMENQVNITFALEKEASDRLAHIEGLLTAILQEIASGKEQVLQTVAPTPRPSRRLRSRRPKPPHPPPLLIRRS